MHSILDAVPHGWDLRPEQRDLLLQLEANWKTYDIFRVVAPTAVGKSLVAKTLANWASVQSSKGSTSIIVPNNVLVNQFLEAFPDTSVLHKQDAYHCDQLDQSCKATKMRRKFFCQQCPYMCARKEAKDSRVRLANYWTYMSNRLYGSTLIVDEAHQLVDMMSAMDELRIWQSQYKFPRNMRTLYDIVVWAQAEQKRRPDDEKLESLILNLTRLGKNSAVEYREDMYRGQPDLMLHVRSTETTQAKTALWPSKYVRKIVLLSATIGRTDIAELGLLGRRVISLESDAPIPVAHRPVLFRPAYNMGRQYWDAALPILAERVTELLKHRPEKGIIHLPYSLAQRLQVLVNHPRLMWHDRGNKIQVLAQFRADTTGRVLVASGLYEGVDLPYDAARWQVIAKVPFLSLGDERVAQRAEKDPDWYAWEAIKRIMQATGRIVRAVDDWGVTGVWDASFERLVRDDDKRAEPLIPKYFRKAIDIPT
jgi:Rad3-related DNA helicase